MPSVQSVDRAVQQLELARQKYESMTGVLEDVQLGRPYEITWKGASTVTIGAGVGTTARGTMEVNVNPGLLVCQAVYEATGAFTLLIRDTESNEEWMNRQVHIDNFAGTAQNPAYLPTRRAVGVNSTIIVEMTNLVAGANIVYLQFRCIQPWTDKQLRRH